MKDININDYDYNLPDDRIAQYPANERDTSQLLVYKENKIFKNTFSNIADFLPSDSLLVFNNTRVIKARILFRKKTGAIIELLCLEPLTPADYATSFSSKGQVEWKCIVGNLKKWKIGTLSERFRYKVNEFNLTAERFSSEGDAWRIRFTWDNNEMTFGEVIESAGHVPLPPYINRADQNSDNERYQTVYSRIDGSVAAPTAGLHFTDNVFKTIRNKGIGTAEITLHVGAGTFQPVKAGNISEHIMHCEHFSVSRDTIKLLLDNIGKTIAVGTTSVRTLESLYWFGVKLINKTPDHEDFSLGQWEADELKSEITAGESLEAVINYLTRHQTEFLNAATRIIIVPGYEFRLTNGMITNFHQPRSTLLLLISAWTGIRWKEMYDFALKNNFRFLSYGDSSLLLK